MNIRKIPYRPSKTCFFCVKFFVIAWYNKKWSIYDGNHWVADIGSLNAMELAKDLADALLIHSVTIKDEDIRN